MQLFFHSRMLLVLSCLSLQAATFAQGDDSADAKEENQIDPFDLARQLRSEICTFNATQVEEFYKGKRDEENRNYQFPDPSINGQHAYDRRSNEVDWYARSLLGLLQPSFGRRLENITTDVFTWCIHPLSTTTDIHGCINSTHRWSTPNFKALGLLDIMSLKNDTRVTIYKGRLVLDVPKAVHPSVLKGALVSCTIRMPNNTTIGVYSRLDLEHARGASLIGVSSQSDAFLVEGQPKNLTCESHGDTVIGYHWYRRAQDGHFVKVFQPVLPVSRKTIGDAAIYQLRYSEEEIADCEFAFTQGNRYKRDTDILAFVSPTVNDTGEFKCATSDSQSGLTVYVAVVFTTVPPNQILYTKGSSSQLTCEFKAPSGSAVYWTQNQVNKKECQVPASNVTSNVHGPTLCNTTAVVHTVEEVVDDTYSIFHLELQFSEVSFSHLGEYSCTVEYTIGSLAETQRIQQSTSVFVDTDQAAGVGNPKSGEKLSKFQIAGVLVGIFLFCFLVGVTVTVGLFQWVRCFKKKRRRKRIVRLSKGRFSARNEVYNEVSLLSPGIDKPHPFEFPRSNLELQDVLGKGRFGKVYKGKAYGIVPDAPNLNTVAVKTTANEQLHSCTQQLLSELEMMARIQPHENICNLLATCTSPDGPLYIIMEYACHGNLKDYLEQCRKVLLQKHITVRISSEEERPQLQQLLISSCDTEGSEATTPSETRSDILHFTVPNSKLSNQESNKTLGYDHLPPVDTGHEVEEEKVSAPVWSTGYDRLSALEEASGGCSRIDDFQVTIPIPVSSDPESKLGYDHLPPVDTVCTAKECEGTAAMWSTGYDRLSAAKVKDCDPTLDVVYATASSYLITNSNLCDFAYQIASGLQHLENMNIVHCDLAARNILIAEGFVLKIGDFGMARSMSSDARYQRVQLNDESLIAIKWAALEVLEKEIYSFKSDIWSLANVVWEIATYGCKPFADFVIGASIEQFIQHLKDGNRPSQPEGLSSLIYEELCNCWSAEPNLRPSASALAEQFLQLKENHELGNTAV